MQIITQEYKQFLFDIKSKIQSAQLKAHIKVNEEMLKLYWEIGSMIISKQKESSWGDKILENISKDLKEEFPALQGFSLRNIHYMKKWVLFYSNSQQSVDEIVQQLVAQIFQIPWGHNIHIISKAKNIDEALFYISKTIENNYSRAQLVEQMSKELYLRSGKAVTNFESKLPKPQSALANEITKDPYNFDFLTLRESYDEKELEEALIQNMTKFLLELGSGFAFVGQQYKITVDNNDFKIDLLFYHVKLHCFVVVELKTTDFKPEYTGKLNFYITAVDEQIKTKFDNPTIGILICKSKSDTIVEYALRNVNTPIGISEYQLTEILPKEYESSLPTIEQIEAELKGFENE
ncbi:PDDEXK nuclease domain-containing protein [Aliarcobacter cryaerophilus]|uniref:PDDEXK nuclease domain-containing protein n=1 Tax=Aliarcobacter cryaerophilus TaxID=28198 RepID=UPI003DA1E43C